MYIRVSYDAEFEDLLFYLRSKYNKKLFNLDGIGEEQLDMSSFSKNFFASSVAADVSIDANANVSDMNMIVYNAELPKPFFRLNSYFLLWKELKRIYSLEAANNIIEQQIIGDIYINDAHNVQLPYCWNYSCYDIALLGLPMVSKIKSIPPKHLFSFKSQVEQFVIIAANSTLGATGIADFLLVLSYYVDKILKTKKDAHFTFASDEDIWSYVRENLISFIYIVNQPNRAQQSAFTNISIFDDYFLDKLLPDYNFIDDDGNTINPQKDTVKKLQVLFLDCMNDEMKRTPITFPVTTACFSINIEKERAIQDKKFLYLISEKNLKYAFINIYAGETSTLSSCCRLRSKMLDQYDIGYSNSLGGSSTKVGSLGVCTINLPRVAFKAKGNEEKFFEELTLKAQTCIRVNNAKRHILKKRIDNGNLPLYTHGFMELSKQYSTIGLNGINEMCSIMGYDILEEEGQEFVLKVLNVINSLNDVAQKKYKSPHNCEQIPGESVSVKLCEKDKIMNYHDGEFILYSNQFIPLITEADLLDRIRLQGLFDSHFSGGAICHVNVEEEIKDVNLMIDVINLCAKMGVVYFAINYNIQRCENDHIQVGKSDTCYECGAPIKESFTRIVGFLVPVRSFNKIRREADYPSRQFYNGEFEKTVHKTE